MKPIILTDLEHAGKILTRVASRMNQTAIGLLSPSILHLYSNGSDENGLVGRILFPCDGTITKLALHIVGANPKNKLGASIEVKSNGLTVTKTVLLSEESVLAKYSLEIKEGDIISVSSEKNLESEVLIAVVFMPKLGEYKVENYLRDNLERIEDEGIRNALD